MPVDLVIVLKPVMGMKIAFMGVTVLVAKVMGMVSARTMRVPSVKAGISFEEEVGTQGRNQQAGDRSQPGVQLLGNDIARSVKRYTSKHIYAGGVRGGDDQSEDKGMIRGTLRSCQISGYYRFSVAGFERVQSSESRGDQSGDDEEGNTKPVRGHELREAILGRGLLVFLEQGLRRRSYNRTGGT